MTAHDRPVIDRPYSLCASVFFRQPSELQTHRKLDDAWPAAGDAGGGAHGSCDGATHGCGDFAEIRIALVVLRIRKIRMVEHIEELGAELQA